MRLHRRRLARDPSSAGQGMEVKLNENCAMNRRLVLEDDPKVSHRSKKGRTGEHEVVPGGLQTGGCNARRLVSRLAKSVGNSTKITRVAQRWQGCPKGQR